MTEIPASVPSSKATGGAGTIFEQHTDAAFLGWLLVGAHSPIFVDCPIIEVHVQAKHLGWHTDDILVVSSGTTRKRQLAAQIKSSFTISSKNDTCRETFEGFWKDFESTTRFHPEFDALVLIVQHGTKALLARLNGLLDQARASGSSADFAHRMSLKKFLHQESKDQAAEIRNILNGAASRSITDEDFWRFLKVVHVQSFDLCTSTAQTEAHVKTLLALTATNTDKKAAVSSTWGQLLALAGRAMANAASYTRSTFPETLRQQHALTGAADHAAISALQDHSSYVLKGISTSIANSVFLRRDTLVAQCLDLLETNRVLVVTGPSGAGKSGVGKLIVESLQPHCPVFAFRAETLATPHLDDAIRSITTKSAHNVFALLGTQGRKVLLIESVERLLEASNRDGFSDLLNTIRTDESWRVVLTCRDYSLEIVRASFLEHAGVAHVVVATPPLSDAELDEVQKAIPALEQPMKRPALKSLFRNPYILNKATSDSADKLYL